MSSGLSIGEEIAGSLAEARKVAEARLSAGALDAWRLAAKQIERQGDAIAELESRLADAEEVLERLTIGRGLAEHRASVRALVDVVGDLYGVETPLPAPLGAALERLCATTDALTELVLGAPDEPEDPPAPQASPRNGAAPSA